MGGRDSPEFSELWLFLVTKDSYMVFITCSRSIPVG